MRQRAHWSPSLPATSVSSSVLKQWPALSNLPVLSSLAWSPESHSLTSTDPSAICPLILFNIFSLLLSKKIIFHLSVFNFSTVFFFFLVFLSWLFSPYVGVLSIYGVGLGTCRSHLSPLWCVTAHVIYSASLLALSCQRNKASVSSSASTECWKMHSTGGKCTLRN